MLLVLSALSQLVEASLWLLLMGQVKALATSPTHNLYIQSCCVWKVVKCSDTLV